LNETAIAALATLTQILRFAMEVQILTLGVLVLKKKTTAKNMIVFVGVGMESVVLPHIHLLPFVEALIRSIYQYG